MLRRPVSLKASRLALSLRMWVPLLRSVVIARLPSASYAVAGGDGGELPQSFGNVHNGHVAAEQALGSRLTGSRTGTSSSR
jgi:hypothetical protein